MFKLSLTLALAVSLAFPSSADVKVRAGTLVWKDLGYEAGAWPDGFGPATTRALEHWSGFAAREGYRLELTDDERVLYVGAWRKKAKRELGLVHDTLARFDALLPPDAAGDASRAEEAETIVLLHVDDQEAYERVIARCIELEPYLESWEATAASVAGFVLERPLCATWMKNPPGTDEWNADNELVHRLTNLLLMQRYGRLPYWLQMGIAWNVEEDVAGSIYCFPYRAGFVGALEHSGWDKRLKRLAKKDASGFSIDHVAGWKRGSYDEEAALYAFGAVGFLDDHRAGALDELLRALQTARDEQEIVHHPDGTWEKRVDFELDRKDQERILRALDPALFETLQEAFEKGSSYRP